MINVALLSKWHVHAVDYAREAKEHPRISIKMVWDEIPERGKQWADELGAAFEADLDAILSNPDIDAVIVTTPTNIHKDVIVKAAKSGKHIYSEKVLASTVEQCEEIFAAVQSSNVKLMLSLPRMVEPYYLYAKQVVDLGLLGKLTLLRCRCAHSGAVPFEGHPNGFLPAYFFDPMQCGGGALIDLGAHPIYLTNRLAGSASAVTARLTSFFDYKVDDNAAVIVEYDSGALGILETSFVSNGSPFLIELHGTEGTLLIEDEHIRLRSTRLQSDGWVVPDILPDKLPTPMEQWVNSIEQEEASYITFEDAWRLTQINQAAALSHREGRRIVLEDDVKKPMFN